MSGKKVEVVSLRDDMRRAQGEVSELEAARLRLSADVMEGRPEALEVDRCLEKRIRGLPGWIVSAEKGGGSG